MGDLGGLCLKVFTRLSCFSQPIQPLLWYSTNFKVSICKCTIPSSNCVSVCSTRCAVSHQNSSSASRWNTTSAMYQPVLGRKDEVMREWGCGWTMRGEVMWCGVRRGILWIVLFPATWTLYELIARYRCTCSVVHGWINGTNWDIYFIWPLAHM